MATLAPGEKARMYALGKIARGGATRGGYTSSLPFISIGGIDVGTGPASQTQRVLVESLTIADALDDNPNTCSFTAQGFAPAIGAEIIITQGSKNSGTRMFAGRILSEVQGYFLDKPLAPSNAFFRVNAIDYGWELNQLLAIRRYTANTVGGIIRDLFAWYVPGFTLNNLNADVDVIIVDEITFTNTSIPDALTQLCNRVGAYWYTDYFRDLHVFFNEPATVYPNPTPLTPTHRSLAKFSDNRDLSQMITRAIVEGGGVNAMTDIPIGETVIPVESSTWYQKGGGVATSGPQRIVYSDVLDGGGGSFVGPGAGPSAAPTVIPSTTAGALGSGTYQYAYTDVTASGESRPGPAASASAAPAANPPAASSFYDAPNGGIGMGSYIGIGWRVRMCYVYATNVPGQPGIRYSLPSPVTPFIITRSNGDFMNPGMSAPVILTGPYSTDPRIVYVLVYLETQQGDGTPVSNGLRYWQRTIGNTPGQTFQVSSQGAAGSSPSNDAPPSANTTAATAIDVSAIAVGPPGTTARKLYRSAVNGSALLLVTTIADNTTTTYTDVKADGALGAAAPVGDTSALVMPDGQVPAGSTSLLVASIAAFSANGGYVVIGNGEQVVRYTGISSGVAGNLLTGIPKSGGGSITAAVAYNSTATAAAALIGANVLNTGSILFPIKGGDEVNLIAVVDDAHAQTVLASYIGGTGVKETYIQDRRISYTEAVARGKAVLAQRNTLSIEIAYTVRDPQTRSGRTASVNLPAPIALVGDFKIQDVTIAAFSAKPGTPPTYTVRASSAVYKLEDLLRLARGRIGA